MSKLFLGHDPTGRKLYLEPEIRERTHLLAVGATGKGKTAFTEHLIRGDIHAGRGCLVIGWHPGLVSNLLRFCADLDVGLYDDNRRVVLLDPSHPTTSITGFNPFLEHGPDLSVDVNRWVTATIKPWGDNADAMPTYEATCRTLYQFMGETGQVLPNATKLLDFEQRELREYARQVTQDSYTAQQWRRLQRIKTDRDWEQMVLSTQNRLARFVSSRSIQRFMGLTEPVIDLIDCMDNRKIVLIDLSASKFLDREAARVFASLLLYQLFHTAMLRAEQAATTREKRSLFPIHLDEFPAYATSDLTDMLDQCRKGGCLLTLVHQHLAQLEDQKLLKSVMTNCGIKVCFGGLAYEDAMFLAPEMFLSDLNQRQVQKAIYHLTHAYEEQTRTVRSRGTSSTSGWSKTEGHGEGRGSSSGVGVHTGRVSGSGQAGPVEGWLPSDATHWNEQDSLSSGGSQFSGESEFSSDSYSEGEHGSETDSESESVVPVWVPIPIQELASESTWSLEEKKSKVAELLKCPPSAPMRQIAGIE